MNLKVANVIAVELAILIGLMSWMVFSRPPSAEPRTPAETQESTAEPVATVAPVLEARNEHPATVDYSADRERARRRDEQTAPTSQAYVQEIAAQPYANPGLENGAIAADSPSYAEVDQEPAVAPSNYPTSAQTVAYAQPTQIVVYPQPVQIVVFSNARHFANRHRSAPHPGSFMTMTPRRPDGDDSRRSGDGAVFPQNARPPIQGFRPRRGHG
jgi:hypothetical protein